VAPLFPVHGFVLAGGKSSRMGTDKAILNFRGRPMIAIAVETLRSVCEEVSIAGNRDDLAEWATVVRELREGEGPAAGIEAALIAASRDWVLMLPVDLPMMSDELLRRWVGMVLASKGVRASYMEAVEERHPALCLAHRECLPVFREELNAGDRKLTRIFQRFGKGLLVVDASELMEGSEAYFANLNTPEELAAAEQMKY
jgi:molybdopterin-guanine dinucleotide biosynthesis protein A